MMCVQSIELLMNDIATLDIECIVNAANTRLLGGGGVDGHIHRLAGPRLLRACRCLHGCGIGQAKITKGYKLKAKYVIHTVGPVYTGKETDEILLGSCYTSSLNLAKHYHIHHISFPTISSGAFGYPIKESAKVAILAVSKWLEDNCDYEMKVTFCCYYERTYLIYEKVYKEFGIE